MVFIPLLMPLHWHVLLVAKKSWLPIHKGPSTEPYLKAPRTKIMFLSLFQKRPRWCASFSFRVICTREPLAILEMVGPHDRDTWFHAHIRNSYPRSRHVEADAQVTLEALCLLHNAPAQIQGRERRNGWFLDRTVSTQIKYLPTLLSLQIRCVLIAALENIL